MSKEVKSTFEEMLKRDKASADVARIVLAEKMIEFSDATDLSEEQVISLTGLEAINSLLKSEFLEIAIDRFKKNRKSLNRKDRKEFVDMFKHIAEEEKSRLGKVRDLLGLGG